MCTQCRCQTCATARVEMLKRIERLERVCKGLIEVGEILNEGVALARGSRKGGR